MKGKPGRPNPTARLVEVSKGSLPQAEGRGVGHVIGHYI